MKTPTSDLVIKYLGLIKKLRAEVYPLINLLPDETKTDRNLTIIVLIFRRTIHTLDTVEYLLREYKENKEVRTYYYADTALILIRRTLEDFVLFKKLLDSKTNIQTIKKFYDFETKELYDAFQYLIEMGVLKKVDYDKDNSETNLKYQALSNNTKKAKSFLQFERMIKDTSISLTDQQRFLAAYNFASRAIHCSPLELNRWKDEGGFSKLSNTSAATALNFILYIALNETREILSIYIALGYGDSLKQFSENLKQFILEYKEIKN